MSFVSQITAGNIPTNATTNRKIFKRYLSTDYLTQRPIFDTVNSDYNLARGAGLTAERQGNVLRYVGVSGSMKGRRGVYDAGAISKGMSANDLAAQEGPFYTKLADGAIILAAHVYDMDENVGSQRTREDIQSQTKRKQIQNQTLLRTVFDGMNILVPTMLQVAVGMTGQAEFDRGFKRRDNGFMQLWTPIIRELISVFPVVDDWFFSGATSGLEYPEAECIAAGLRPLERPDADLWFLDWNGEPVSQYEIIRRRAEYLLWAAEHGNFYLKHEATAFMRSCAIAEMANRGLLPNCNPVFMQGISDNFADIKYLQKEIEPLIIERVHKSRFLLDTKDLESVNPDFLKRLEEGTRQALPLAQIQQPTTAPIELLANATINLATAGIEIHRYTSRELAAGDFGFKEIGHVFDRDQYLDLTDNDALTLPLPPVDMSGEAASLNDGRSLFARRLLDNTNERERHQISMTIGGLETVMTRGGRSVYIIGNHKDAKKMPLLKRFLAQQRPVQFSSQLDAIIRTLDFLPEMSMAAGEARPGQDAVQLIRQTVLARRTTDFCFVSGQWEHTTSGAQDMVMVTRMQLGVEAASPTDPQFIRVFDEQGRYLTLADRVTALWEKTEDALKDKNCPASTLTEQISAVAQLYALHRLARNHTMRHHVFDRLREQYPELKLPEELKWERITPFLFAYDHVNLEDYWRTRIKPVLEKRAANAVSLRHMDFIEDFKALREKQHATQEIDTSPPPPVTMHYGSNSHRHARPK